MFLFVLGEKKMPRGSGSPPLTKMIVITFPCGIERYIRFGNNGVISMHRRACGVCKRSNDVVTTTIKSGVMDRQIQRLSGKSSGTILAPVIHPIYKET